MGSWARTGRGCTLHSGGCTARGLGPARVEVLAGLRRRVHLCRLRRAKHHRCSLPRGKRWLWESRGPGGWGACGLGSFVHFIWCHIRVPPAPPRLRISPQCGLQVLGIRRPSVSFSPRGRAPRSRTDVVHNHFRLPAQIPLGGHRFSAGAASAPRDRRRGRSCAGAGEAHGICSAPSDRKSVV